MNAIVVFESSLHGHRVQYVKHLLAYLVSSGHRVIVVLPVNAMGSNEFLTELSSFTGCINYDFAIPPHPSNGVSNVIVRWRALKDAMIRHGPANVIIPTGDLLVAGLWLFWFYWWRREVRNSNLQCVLLRIRNKRISWHAREIVLRVGTWISMTLSPWRHWWSIDPRAAGTRWGQKIRYLPDPVAAPPSLSRIEAREALGLSKVGSIVVCVGVLDERKGVDCLVRAFSTAVCDSGSILCLAGEASPGVAPVIREAQARLHPSGRIHWVNRRLTDEEINYWLLAANVVCVPYVSHDGLSSLVIKGALARRWLLGCARGWIGETIRRYRIGRTCDPEKANELSNALILAIEMARSGERGYPTLDWLKQHSPQAFAKALVNGEQTG